MHDSATTGKQGSPWEADESQMLPAWLFFHFVRTPADLGLQLRAILLARERRSSSC